MPTVTDVCSICGLAEPDARNLQRCFDCGRFFHLNPRSDVDGVDCGDAWVGESLGVEYYCQTCIERIQGEVAGNQDPTLARHAELMQLITPGYPGLEAGPEASTYPRRGEPPPRPQRPRIRRRYRRIDR